MKQKMRLRLKCFGALIIVCNLKGSFASLEHHVDWTTASRDCSAQYDSHLIPQSYIEDQNLHSDVIQGIGVNVSAWVDGKIQQIGCDHEKCLKMKMLFEKKNRKMPYICVTSRQIDVTLTNVSFTTSEVLCNLKKVKLEDRSQRNALLSRLNELSERQTTLRTLWLPNVEWNNNRDTNCTYVASRTNSHLETMSGNCSIRRMGVCINTTYLVDYQMSVILEINMKRLPLFKLDDISTTEDISKIKEEEGIEFIFETHTQPGKRPPTWTVPDSDMRSQDVPRQVGSGQIQDASKYSDIKDTQNFFSFVVSIVSLVLVLTSMGIGIILWKRTSSKLDILMKCHHFISDDPTATASTSKRRTKFQKKVYETLPEATHGHSTRVKGMTREEENPYSEIAGRRWCRHQNNSGTLGHTEAEV